jgi:hypothetical protein
MVNRVPSRGRLVAMTFVVALLAALMLAASSTASAAGPNASCMGHEASSISPPGSSEEVSGGMPELVAFFRSTGAPAGALVTFIASLHAGSHEACDEILEG